MDYAANIETLKCGLDLPCVCDVTEDNVRNAAG